VGAHPEGVVGGNSAEDVRVADERAEKIDGLEKEGPGGRGSNHGRIVRRVEAYHYVRVHVLGSQPVQRRS
jgi:hypothetical protein